MGSLADATNHPQQESNSPHHPKSHQCSLATVAPLLFALVFPFRASLAAITKLETKGPTNKTYTLNMAQKARDSVRVLAEDIAAHRDPTGEVEVDTTVPKSNPNFCLLARGHL